ncbi:MAG: aldo/keto reductase [Planctomycetia bacterium]|nr:aldo/keto reductase [Planctomycetia bacterium]
MDADVVGGLIEKAVGCGYRHLDSACDYGNEAEAGLGIERALAAGLCRRDELWVTSKLWNTYHAPEHVRPALERTLRDLRLDYLDCYLVHFPIALAYVAPETRYPPGWFFDPNADTPAMRPVAVPQAETWQAMEQAPSYVPLGMAKESESLLAHPAIVEIARAMNRTPAQLLLRWGVQRGTAVIPKTSRPERLVENLSVFDFALSAAAMAAISSLNEDRRYNDPGVFCEQAFGTFLPIYE